MRQKCCSVERKLVALSGSFHFILPSHRLQVLVLFYFVIINELKKEAPF